MGSGSRTVLGSGSWLEEEPKGFDHYVWLLRMVKEAIDMMMEAVKQNPNASFATLNIIQELHLGFLCLNAFSNLYSFQYSGDCVIMM